ncbi:hypothetical protein EW026_g1896 [Hermanssonia centrifuga]|uniref:Uncharacterized protein n=1 Tax=Hermanssonia centrifuga TaxID=98765 RepID=A0A4S4KQY0_9APHY|nr:hypothetical protein EW026_g1896 [Hermanssonia centrifuga]
MHLSPIETALNMQLTNTPVDADLHTYGFPAGYFIIKNAATDRLLDVQSDLVEDGTPLILCFRSVVFQIFRTCNRCGERAAGAAPSSPRLSSVP